MADAEKYSHKIIKKIRLKIPRGTNNLEKITSGLNSKGVMLGEITTVSSALQHNIYDMKLFFDSLQDFTKTIKLLKKLKNYKILNIEDVILSLHKGGKVAVKPLVKLESISDLRMVYTPGVAQVCNYIKDNPQAAREYTSIGNTVCIATNGSAVLGLGDIGVLPAMPVMEGKSLILYNMAHISCVPLLINSSEADRIVDILSGLEKTFAAIMIEDIKAPLCFEVEEKLQKKVSIPVFHDDQHGTSTVILAALIKALEITGKKKKNVRIVVSGAGAAAIATCRMLLTYGFSHIVLCDRAGAIYQGRKLDMNPYKKKISLITNREREKGVLGEIIKDKDIFIGLSAPGLVSPEMIHSMQEGPIVFALANPVPEIWPKLAQGAGASIALDGRTINNALVFPGLMRGTLDAKASEINYAMKFAAAETLANLAVKGEVVANFMNLAVHEKVAKVVCSVARKSSSISS